MRLKSEKNNDNHFSNCSLKILNLHRKSEYQQNKNIARFLKHKLRALCSYFNDFWISYANLKFSVSSCWNDCHYFFHFLVSSESNFLQAFCIFGHWQWQIGFLMQVYTFKFKKINTSIELSKNSSVNGNFALWVNSSYPNFSASYAIYIGRG